MFLVWCSESLLSLNPYSVSTDMTVRQSIGETMNIIGNQNNFSKEYKVKEPTVAFLCLRRSGFATFPLLFITRFLLLYSV